MKLSKQKIAPLVLLLVIAGIAIVVALVVYKPNKKENKPTSSTTTQAAIPPISPTAVAKDVAKYKGKHIAVQGTVYQLPDKQYILISSDQPPSAVRLDFSKTKIDPSQYANQANTSHKVDTRLEDPHGQVIVTGTFTQGTTKNPYYLLVESVK
jgi:hypothetical protein